MGNPDSVWQSYAKRALTPGDLRAIRENMVGFFSLLLTWDSSADANSRSVTGASTGKTTPGMPLGKPVEIWGRVVTLEKITDEFRNCKS